MHSLQKKKSFPKSSAVTDSEISIGLLDSDVKPKAMAAEGMPQKKQTPISSANSCVEQKENTTLGNQTTSATPT